MAAIKDFSGKKSWGTFAGSSGDIWLKFHFVHKRLLAALCVDLQDRGFTLSEVEEVNSVLIDEPGMIAVDRPVEEVEEVNSVLIDEPGMIAVDRPVETVKLDLLKVTVPSEDVSSILERLGELRVRTFKDGTRYFKLKTWNVCLVLDESQKEFLENTLLALVDKAEKKASAFYDQFVKSMGPHDGEIN
jgi:hypothetical protein